MSVEEEIELRDLVAQTLESNGCLAKIRAQLRASIFLALDEDVQISNQQPLLNNKVRNYLQTDEGKLTFSLVREFLEFFNLYITLSVFDPESYIGSCYNYEGREKIAQDLGLNNADDSTVPLLLQLIKIAQTKSENLDINLKANKIEIEENKSIIQDNSTSNLNKTDCNDMSSNETLVNRESDKLLIENLASDPEKMNATFELSSPTVNFNIVKKAEMLAKAHIIQVENNLKDQGLDSTYNKAEEKDDDTSGDTSSIADDIAFKRNGIVPEININGTVENINDSVSDSEVSQPILKDNKTDKTKISPQKTEKFKTINSLSSLSDLPPLQMNKPRVNDILPSLYSKEFKDKSNLRELDKLFDMEAEYEEDFICSGDDLSLKSDYMKSDHSDDLEQPNKSISTDKSSLCKKDIKPKTANRIISDCNKPMFKPLSSKTKETFKTTDLATKSAGTSEAINDFNSDIKSSN